MTPKVAASAAAQVGGSNKIVDVGAQRFFVHHAVALAFEQQPSQLARLVTALDWGAVATQPESIAVVDELHAELAAQAEQIITASPPPSPGSPWTASGFGAAPIPGPSSGPGQGLSLPSLASGLAAPAAKAAQTALTARTHRRPPDPDKFGAGEAVTLPDGSTASAPNKVAADAVRHALTQLGVPYVWGGTTPGIGLDCSGLTQWAYREAGLDLPRLAQEQDIGAAVDRGALRPGDLAVWDGHVAMIVGNGLMVEAGDPVQLSPIRTTNLDQGFHGFFRPTA